MTTSETPLPADLLPILADALLAAADDELFIGHAASEWTGIAPTLEEDIAFSSMAQDEVAHAREWYALAGQLLGRSTTQDALAFGRAPAEYRCAALVIQPDEFDFSVLVARQFYYDHFDSLRVNRWVACRHRPVADLARRIAAEEVFHTHHVNDWIRRLARGTPDARQRIQSALDKLWPFALGLFEETAGADRLVAGGWCKPAGQALYDDFWREVHSIVIGAGLSMPSSTTVVGRLQAGGRAGKHPALLETVLGEMAEVYRSEQAAVW